MGPLELTQGIADFLICLTQYAVGLVRFMLVELFEVFSVFIWVVTLPFEPFLPEALDQPLPDIESKYLGYANWIFPVGFVSQLFAYVIGAFAVYRVLKWIAARLKGPIQPRLF